MKITATTVARCATIVELFAGVELVTMAYGVERFPRPLTTSMTHLSTLMKTQAGKYAIAMYGSMLLVFGAGAAAKMRAPKLRVGQLMFALFHALCFANAYAFRLSIPGVWPVAALFHAACAILFHMDDVDLGAFVPAIGKKAPGGKKSKSPKAAKKTPSRQSQRKR